MTNGRLGVGAYKMTPDIYSYSRGRKGPKTTISTSKGTNQIGENRIFVRMSSNSNTSKIHI